MTALERLRAEREAQDARMAAMWLADKPKAPAPAPASAGGKKEIPAPAPPKQRYIMKGD